MFWKRDWHFTGPCWSITQFLQPSVPNLFGTRDWFHGKQFFHGLVVGQCFQDDLSALHLLHTLFLLLLHQLYLRSASFSSQSLETPALLASGRFTYRHHSQSAPSLWLYLATILVTLHSPWYSITLHIIAKTSIFILDSIPHKSILSSSSSIFILFTGFAHSRLRLSNALFTEQT